MTSRRASPAIIVAAVVLLVLGAAALLLISKITPPVQLYLGSGVFDARVAYTQAEREKGLSGVETLSSSQALIFTYSSDDIWPIWMKDMKIPIDIVWLDSDKKVIYIVKDASPDTGTDVIYKPQSAARYVIELPAGTVDGRAVRIGQAAVFDIEQDRVE